MALSLAKKRRNFTSNRHFQCILFCVKLSTQKISSWNNNFHLLNRDSSRIVHRVIKIFHVPTEFHVVAFEFLFLVPYWICFSVWMHLMVGDGCRVSLLVGWSRWVSWVRRRVVSLDKLIYCTLSKDGADSTQPRWCCYPWEQGIKLTRLYDFFI